MFLRDDVADVLCAALDDAAHYRALLADGCPGRCAERGQTCDTCAADREAAAEYEWLCDLLAEEAALAGELPPPSPAPGRPDLRLVQTVRVAGGRL